MKKTLRRTAALLLALMVSLCAAHTEAVFVNGQWVIFTIANDTLLPLNYGTMPYRYSSMVYVPYTVFTDYLGIRGMYNAEDNVLILANPERTLFYDLANGKAYDDAEYGYARKATANNGTIYVPARFTAEFFGLLYSSDDAVPMVRVRDPASSQSDAAIEEYYKQEFASRLEAFQNASTAEPPEEESDPVPASLYLMFTGELTEYTPVMLDTLKQHGVRAVFFLSADTIRGNEALVRRLYVDGHVPALSAGMGVFENPEELAALYGEANAALFSVLHVLSSSVCLPGSSRSERYDGSWFRALTDAGYRYWDFTVIADDYFENANAETVLRGVTEALTAAEETQTVVMHCTKAAAEALPRLLEYMQTYIQTEESAILTPEPLTPAITF